MAILCCAAKNSLRGTGVTVDLYLPQLLFEHLGSDPTIQMNADRDLEPCPQQYTHKYDEAK